MRAALLEYRYVDLLVEALKNLNYEIIRTTPDKSLYMYLADVADVAMVSSVVASSLALEPCLSCPAVFSVGRVENVKIKFLRRRKRIKLWITSASFTGRALARWYLERQGYDYVCVNRKDEADALVEIGDEARTLEGDVVDLGEAWYSEVKKPLVYAVTLSKSPLDLNIRYKWRYISVSPLKDVIDAYLETVKRLRNYWLRPPLPSRGLLGLLLRSLK